MNDFIKNIKGNINKAYNPTFINLNNLTIETLKNLKNNKGIIIKHQHIKNLNLYIRKEFIIDEILGVPTILYSNKFIIKDNSNNLRPLHNVQLKNKEMVKYVNSLLRCNTKSLFIYQKSLKEKNYKINDIIEFDNGIKGVICLPIYEIYNTNLFYIPLKKDGTLSKHKPRIIYGNDKYKKIGIYK